MVKSAIKVVLRTRPTAKFAADNITLQPDKQTVNLRVKKRNPGGGDVGLPSSSARPKDMHEEFQFKFDHVLHNTSQEGAYEACAQEAVQTVLDGVNCTIMAYGQTGAGKTYTMTGGKANFQQRGLIPRCISDLFNSIKAHPQMSVTVRIAHCEIYNEQFYDLLAPYSRADIQVMEDAKGAVFVKGLTYHVAASEEDALGLLFEGETNRAIAEHQLNKASSRSHTLFSMTLEVRPQGAADERVLVSKLHMVDLAGSERLSKTKSEGTVAREAQYINKSLSFLEQVIVALSNRSREHIPYRSSKLTHILKDSIGGNCKTMMIANVWGEEAQLEETLSTCKFAQRMSRVANDPNVNLRQDPEMLMRRYEREIKELRQELAMHDAINGRGHTVYEPYTPVQRSELRVGVKEFLERDDPQGQSGVEPLDMPSLRHMREILLQCRELYQAVPFARAGPCKACGAEPGEMKRSGPRTSQSGVIGGDAAGTSADHEEMNMVGDLDDQSGYDTSTMPCAPDDARPADFLRKVAPGAAGGTEADGSSPPGTPASRSPMRPPPDKNEAFANFKAVEGAEAAAALYENKLALKKKRAELVALANGLNAKKHSIDQCRAEAERMKEVRGADGQPGSEEVAALLKMRELKAGYRAEHEALSLLKSEVDYTQRLSKECTRQLVAQFEVWYERRYGVAVLMKGVAEEDAASTVAGGDEDKDEDEDRGPMSPQEQNESAYRNAQKAMQRRPLAAKPKPPSAQPKVALGGRQARM